MNQENDLQRHIPILDGIRAYAVILVCLVHFFQIDESGLYETNRIIGAFLFKVSQIGLKGVELFFILSGFLITGILIDSKKSSKYFTTFYARRFLRIFPLYYFVLFISFFVLPKIIWIDSAGIEIIDKQWWLWTYTSNLSWLWSMSGWDASMNFPSFGHFWSLCVEEHYYLLWPLLIYISSEKWLPRIMWGIVIISASSVLFNYIFDNILLLLNWSTMRCAGVLSLGGLIAWYIRRPGKFNRLQDNANRFLWPSFIIFFLVNFIPRRYDIHDLMTFFSCVTFFALLVTVSLKGTTLTDKLFNHKILFFIGKISYGIYVYHGLLRPYFKNYFYIKLCALIPNAIISSTIYTLICTVVSIFIAWISWQIIESPILRLKKVFTY